MIKENILWLVVVVVITTILIQVIMQKEYLTVGDYTFEDVTAGAYCVDSVADYKGGLNDSVVYNYCVQLRVRFPEIVTAQCKLESGNYTSELCRNNNNITGMRLASVRPRVAITAMNGYAVYKDWQMCLIDMLCGSCIMFRRIAPKATITIYWGVYTARTVATI